MKYKGFYVIVIILHLQVAIRALYQMEQYYSPSSISNSLKLRRSESTKLQPCNEDQLMMYLAEIQAINPESIINLAAVEEIEPLCSKVSDNLSRMDEYLKTCEPPQQKDLYVQLIKGVASLSKKLCERGKYQTNFKRHFKCFHDLHNEFQDCTGPADWTEDSDSKKVCKAYRDIADCYYTKAAKLCGKQAAAVLKELVLAVIDSVLVIKCHDVLQNPIVTDAMPDTKKAAGTNLKPTSFIQVSAYFVVYFIL